MIVGNLVDWWDPESKRRYLEKADCIIEQYGNYTVEVSIELWLTLLSDIGCAVPSISWGDVNLTSTFGKSGRRSSQSAFGRSTGNNVSGHHKDHYFLVLPPFFLHRLLFS